jgi:prenyltransferase beta subunit
MKPLFSVAFACALAFIQPPVARGAEPDKAALGLSRGLAFLAAQQQEDGSIGAGQLRGSVGVTSLAGLALMADEAHAARVKQVAAFLLSTQTEQGFFAGRGERKGSMYDHGYATLFLASYLQATPQPETREKLAKAVELIVKSQGPAGGWRYVPTPGDGDTSMTSCQLMALAAARHAGLAVPAATFGNAVAYLQTCQNADGGFGYTAPGSSAFPRSAAALAAALATTAWTEPARRPDATKGASYVLGYLPQAGENPDKKQFYIHGLYYAGQAMRLVGGETATRWHAAVRENLLEHQKPDGSWSDNLSAELATSEACLALRGK